MTRWVVAFLVAVIFAIPCAARVHDYQLNCDFGKGSAHNIRIAQFDIVLSPENHLCHVAVVGSSKKVLFEYTATGMQVFAGKDFTGDNEPDAIIQADESPIRLFVVSLGRHPGLVKTIENNYGFGCEMIAMTNASEFGLLTQRSKETRNWSTWSITTT